MKRIFLLITLIFVVFVGSANTISPLSKLINGTLNNKVSNTDSHHYVRNYNNNFEINNTNNTPPCDVTANISYAGAPFCSSTTTPQSVTLTGTGVFTGGVFTSTVGLTINSNTGAITPSTSTSGSYTVTYTVSGGIGCPDAVATTTVAINTVPVVANQNITVCSDSALGVNFNSSSTVSVATYNVTALNLNGLTVSAGNAAVASGLVATDLLNDSFSNTVTAPVNVVYTVVPVSATGCQGNPFTVTVTVNPVPQIVPLLTPNLSFVYCNGDSTLSIPFSNINTGGITTYQWTNSSPNIGLAASGVGNIPSFIANNPGSLPIVAAITVIPIFTNGSRSCTGPSRSVSITVNPSGQVTQPTSVIICSNASTNAIPFSTSNIGGTTTYTWTNSTPIIGLAASGSGNIPSFTAINSTSLTVIATITVTPTFSNGGVNCSGASKTFTITVNPRPNVPNQTVTVCSGNSFTVSPVNLPPSTIVSSGTTYTWTVVDNVNVSGENNQSVPQTTISQTLVNLTNTPQTVIYTVTPSSGTMINCVGNSFTVVVTLNPNAIITGNTSVCINGTSQLTGTGTPIANNPWVSSNTAVATVNSTTGLVTGIAAGTCTIFYNTTNTSCVAQTTFTVNQTPAIQNQSATVCSGTPYTVNLINNAPNLIPTGTTYTWTVAPNPNVTGQSNQSVGQNSIVLTLTNTTSFLQTLVYTVTPRTSCNGAPFTLTVMVNPNPCSGFHLNAFLDSNNNGTQDAGENNFPFGQFIYQVNSSTHNVATVTGMYDIYESNAASIYTLRYSINPQLSSYFSVTPTSYTNVQIAATGGMTTYNFPITMNQLNDLGITLIPFGRPIPGFNFQNLILYTNYGTANSAGTITFTKHPALTIGSTSDPLGTTITPSGFNYTFSNLNPRQSKYLYVTMNTPTLPTVSLGQVLCNAATISPASGIDMIASNNSSTNCSFVTGSYDPNDIAESRGREIVFNSFTSQDYLYYTIRFENTGNGNAINIKINNTLNNRLDETTLEMVSSSHDYAMDRVNSAVNWNFSNIQLPPSVAQTNTGKGYIMYKIKPKPGYAIGDIIPNTASIYFDFNPAIITNTFETQFVTALDTPNFENNSFVVYPNPANDQITIDLGNKSTNKDWNYKIVNTLGQEVLIGVLSAQQNIIELNNIKGQGVYFVKVYDSANTLLDTKKVIIRR